MLTRIISGAVGVILIVIVLLFHETLLLPIAVAAIITGMLFELLRTVKLHTCLPILVSVEICGILTPFIYSKFTYCIPFCSSNMTQNHTEINCIMSISSLIVVLGASFVIFITWLKKHNDIQYKQVFFVISSMILVSQAMSCVVRINRLFIDPKKSLFFLIMGLCGAWITDTGAYFTGITLGKYKLCREISPKKTIEGFIGGMIFTGIIYSAFILIYGCFSVPMVLFAFVAGCVCALVGTIGDLSASLLKRQIGLNDYGKIMPGHGGLVDRFDSVLFVLPTFYTFIFIGNMIHLRILVF